MEKNLKHVGVLGMKWGKRKARNLTPSTQHLSKVGGKTSIVTRRYGDKKIIRRTPASPARVQAFLDKKKKEKLNEQAKLAKTKKAAKVVALLITAYNTVKIAQMLTGPGFKGGDLTPAGMNANAYAQWLRQAG